MGKNKNKGKDSWSQDQWFNYYSTGSPSTPPTPITTTTTTSTENPSFTPTSDLQAYGDMMTSLYQTIQTGQENLAHIQGGYSTEAAQIAANAEVSSAGIRAASDQEVAKAYAEAQKYGSELGLEGTKYAADKESAWREAVANIEVQGKLDLQPIINAGLENVSNIEAQAARDVAETTGQYSLKSMQERTAADRDLAKMELAGSMYGLISSVFG